MNRKESEKNIRKIQKMGKTSLGLTLPVELVEKLRWREKQKVKVVLKGRSLIIRDWKK